MASNKSFLINHKSSAAPAQIDAADYIVEYIIFIYAHYIKNGLTVLLHRHTHCDTQPALKNGGGIRCQIVCLFQQRKKTAVQILRRSFNPLDQLPV